MKRLLSILKIFLLLAMVSATPTAWGQFFKASLSSGEVKPGDEFTLTLTKLSSEQKSYSGFQTTINLPKGVSLMKVEKGAGVASTFEAFPKISAAGETGSVSVMLVETGSMTGQQWGEIDLLVLTLKADENAVSIKGSISFTDTSVSEPDGSDISFGNAGGSDLSIEIVEPLPTGPFFIAKLGKTTVSTGDEFTVTLTKAFSDKRYYSGFQTTINLPKGVSLMKVEKGAGVASTFEAFPKISAAGETGGVSVMLVETGSMTGQQWGEIDLLVLTLKINDEAVPATENITFGKTSATEPDGNDLQFENNENGDLSVTINVPATDLKITPESGTVVLGNTAEFTVSLTPASSNSEVTWSLESGGNFARIVEQNSKSVKIEGVAVGDVVVKATSTDSNVSATAQLTVLPITANAVLLSETELEMLTGTTRTLTATVEPDNTTDKEITWSSDNTTVATVTEEGKIVSLSAGTANITATCGEAKGVCVVTVKDIETIEPKPGNGTTEGSDDDTPGGNTQKGGSLKGNDLTLRVGQSAGLELSLTPAVDYDPGLQWSLGTGGTEIVTMNVDVTSTLKAVFTGKKVGETTYIIRLPENGKEVLTGKITVIAENPVTSIEITPAALSLSRNAEAVRLTATVTPSDATIGTLTWSSSDGSVATVGADGTVTPVGEGECTVTASATDGSGITGSCRVTVTRPVDDEFGFEFGDDVIGGKEGISLYIGTTYKFVPKAKDGYELPEIQSWTSDAPATVSVSTDGTVSALALGTATITATATFNGKPVTATCKVTVIPVPATGITLNKETLDLLEGDTVKLIAVISPENVTDPTINWSSDNTSVATVSEEGIVTAVAVGSATITATCGDVSATCKVTVTEKDGIFSILVDSDELFNVYTISGLIIRKNQSLNELKDLGHGTYIIKSQRRTLKIKI